VAPGRAAGSAFAFRGALVGVFLAYGLGAAGAKVRTPTTLLLAGVAVVAFLTAIQTYILQRNVETIREVYTFILGSLATSGWSEVRLALAVRRDRGRGCVGAPARLDVFSVGRRGGGESRPASAAVPAVATHRSVARHSRRGSRLGSDRLSSASSCRT
jgi:hypothetical protein